MEIDPGHTTFGLLAFGYYPISHCLLTTIWAALVAFGYLAVYGSRRGALIAGVAVSESVAAYVLVQCENRQRRIHI